MLSVPSIPKTLFVVGGGVIGVEYACMFATASVRVIIVEKRPRLLEFADAEVVEAQSYHMRDRRATIAPEMKKWRASRSRLARGAYIRRRRGGIAPHRAGGPATKRQDHLFHPYGVQLSHARGMLQGRSLQRDEAETRRSRVRQLGSSTVRKKLSSDLSNSDALLLARAPSVSVLRADGCDSERRLPGRGNSR